MTAPSQRSMVDYIVKTEIGHPLGKWVSDRRAEGVSWASLAGLLHDETGGEVEVTGQTLWRWFGPPTTTPSEAKEMDPAVG